MSLIIISIGKWEKSVHSKPYRAAKKRPILFLSHFYSNEILWIFVPNISRIMGNYFLQLW